MDNPLGISCYDYSPSIEAAARAIAAIDKVCLPEDAFPNPLTGCPDGAAAGYYLCATVAVSAWYKVTVAEAVERADKIVRRLDDE
jgi:hypothetical protein